jgi:hypothetical protein
MRENKMADHIMEIRGRYDGQEKAPLRLVPQGCE